MTTIKKPQPVPLRPAELEARLTPLANALAERSAKGEGFDPRALGASPVVSSFTAHRPGPERPTVLADEVAPARAFVAQVGALLSGITGDENRPLDWGTLREVAHHPERAFPAPKNENERRARDMAGEVVASVVHEQLALESEWYRARSAFLTDVQARGELDTALTRNVLAHVQSPEAQQAVVWAYREKLAATPHNRIARAQYEDGPGEDMAVSFALEAREAQALVNAETSPLARLPVLWRAVLGTPHLDDREVRAMLGTTDLVGFAAEAQARVEAKVGPWVDFVQGRGRGDPRFEG